MSATFAGSAQRLAGSAGVVLGWTPDLFWSATPAELATVVAALRGGGGEAPLDAAAIARMREDYPDE